MRAKTLPIKEIGLKDFVWRDRIGEKEIFLPFKRDPVFLPELVFISVIKEFEGDREFEIGGEFSDIDVARIGIRGIFDRGVVIEKEKNAAPVREEAGIFRLRTDVVVDEACIENLGGRCRMKLRIEKDDADVGNVGFYERVRGVAKRTEVTFFKGKDRGVKGFWKFFKLDSLCLFNDSRIEWDFLKKTKGKKSE